MWLQADLFVWIWRDAFAMPMLLTDNLADFNIILCGGPSYEMPRFSLVKVRITCKKLRSWTRFQIYDVMHLSANTLRGTMTAGWQYLIAAARDPDQMWDPPCRYNDNPHFERLCWQTSNPDSLCAWCAAAEVYWDLRTKTYCSVMVEQACSHLLCWLTICAWNPSCCIHLCVHPCQAECNIPDKESQFIVRNSSLLLQKQRANGNVTPIQFSSRTQLQVLESSSRGEVMWKASRAIRYDWA